MFAVKSTYCIQPSRDITIPFYVADNSIFFNRGDLQVSDINTELFPDYYFVNFENYKGEFISLVNLKEAVSFNSPRCFYQNNDFWIHFVYHNDTKKVIAEVRDAKHFVKDFTLMDLPDDWTRLNVDAIIDTLPIHSDVWIEKCHNSLRILATNDEQKQLARRVYDEAWKILKAREKAKNADKRPTVHDTLAKFGLTDDEFIQAVLGVHETKFANEQARRKTQFEHERNVLSIELRKLLE